MALMLGRSQTGGTSYIDAGDVSNTCFGNVSFIYHLQSQIWLYRYLKTKTILDMPHSAAVLINGNQVNI